MGKSNLLLKITPGSLLLYAVILLLVVLAGKFIVRDALPLYAFDEKTLSYFWDHRWPLIGHISGGIIALAIGPFQFWDSFRNRFMEVHRWLGRMYLLAILVGSIGGTYLAWTTALELNFSFALAMQILAIVWFTTAAMAYISVVRKRITQHKEWMIRSYVVTFAFVIFRWLSDLQIMHDLMSKSAERAPTITWLCWTIPLFITEVIVSSKKKKHL